MEEYPKMYMIGQEYVSDSQSEIIMKFYVSISCVFPTMNIDEKNITMYFDDKDFIIEYKAKMSQALIKDITNGKAEAYVWSYFNDILPYINFAIQKNKYEKGQLLCRAISMFDVNVVEIIEDSQIIKTIAGNVFDNFSESSRYTREQELVYVRDYMDALTAKLYCNYEECIRKIITSIENYYKKEGIKKTTFKDTLEKVMEKMKNEYGRKIIYDDLCYIYDLRNDIVHDALRINHYMSEWKTVCHMGLGALWYFYTNILDKENVIQCIISVANQYLLLDSTFDNFLCRMIQNKEIYKENNSNDESNDTEKSYDEVMFDQMIISEKTKMAIRGQIQS